ncbi:MAG: hypothetical protein Q8R38_06110 [Candidatus Omnitrophota bacterium]|nr:hypothetical protein [Candidatus Omnitrophota bacterium]
MKKHFKYFIQVIAFFLPAFLKIALWRCMGFKIGKRVKIGAFSFIMVDQLSIGDDACIDPFTMIVLLKEFRLGQKSRIAVFTKIYGKGTFKSENRNVVSVQCLIECFPNCSITMKDYSCFGPRNTIYTHGEYLPRVQGYPAKKGDVIIGECSWTGMSTVILPCTTIGPHTVITPGAVLSGNVPGNSFIRASAYKYDSMPIEEKITKRLLQDILRYINNILAVITGGGDTASGAMMDRVLSEPELLFQDLSLSAPGKYRGKDIVIYRGQALSAITRNTIVAGFGLPAEIRKMKKVSWMDFKDYLAGPESDKVLLFLVNQLYSKFILRFLFVKD